MLSGEHCHANWVFGTYMHLKEMDTLEGNNYDMDMFTSLYHWWLLLKGSIYSINLSFKSTLISKGLSISEAISCLNKLFPFEKWWENQV